MDKRYGSGDSQHETFDVERTVNLISRGPLFQVIYTIHNGSLFDDREKIEEKGNESLTQAQIFESLYLCNLMV